MTQPCEQAETVGDIKARLTALEKSMIPLQLDIKHIKYLLMVGLGVMLSNSQAIKPLIMKMFM